MKLPKVFLKNDLHREEVSKTRWVRGSAVCTMFVKCQETQCKVNNEGKPWVTLQKHVTLSLNFNVLQCQFPWTEYQSKLKSHPPSQPPSLPPSQPPTHPSNKHLCIAQFAFLWLTVDTYMQSLRFDFVAVFLVSLICSSVYCKLYICISLHGNYWLLV